MQGNDYISEISWKEWKMQIGRLRGIKFSYSTGDTSFRGEQEQPEIPIGEEEVVVGWWGLVHCTVGQHFMRSFIWYEFNKLAANLYAPGVITGRTAGALWASPSSKRSPARFQVSTDLVWECQLSS